MSKWHSAILQSVFPTQGLTLAKSFSFFLRHLNAQITICLGSLMTLKFKKQLLISPPRSRIFIQFFSEHLSV